jgi:hypothetical protein
LKAALQLFGYVRPYWRRVIVPYVSLFSALGIQLSNPLSQWKALVVDVPALLPGTGYGQPVPPLSLTQL